MMISTTVPNRATAVDTMAAIADTISVALATQPVELPEPDSKAEPYVEIVNGVLIKITRKNNTVHTYLETEFCIISASLLPSQALVARQYILNQAGVDDDLAPIV